MIGSTGGPVHYRRMTSCPYIQEQEPRRRPARMARISDRLLRQSRTVGQLCVSLGADRDAVRLALRHLVRRGLVRREGQQWATTLEIDRG